MWKRLYWYLATCSCENGKYLLSIMDDSAITYDEIIHAEVVWWRNKFWWKKVACKTQNLYISLALLLTTIVLFIAVSIYCYLIKYQVKLKQLLISDN